MTRARSHVALACVLGLITGGCYRTRVVTLETLPSPYLQLRSERGITFRQRDSTGALGSEVCSARSLRARLLHRRADTLMLGSLTDVVGSSLLIPCPRDVALELVIAAHPDLRLRIVEPSLPRTYAVGVLTVTFVAFVWMLSLFEGS